MKRKAHFQRTLSAQTSFEKYGRKSKREQFLDAMNKVVPWSRLLALVEPHYPKAGNGRRPVGLEVMLRSYFVQQWFNCLTLDLKMRSMTRPRCGSLSELIWAWPRHRTRRPSCASVICW